MSLPRRTDRPGVFGRCLLGRLSSTQPPVRPISSLSRRARGCPVQPRSTDFHPLCAAARHSLQGVPLLLSAARLVAWCLPRGVGPCPLRHSRSPSGSLLSRSPFPPLLAEALSLGSIPSWAFGEFFPVSPSRTLPGCLAVRCSARFRDSLRAASAHDLVAARSSGSLSRAVSPGVAGLQRVPAAGLRATRSRVMGSTRRGVFRPLSSRLAVLLPKEPAGVSRSHFGPEPRSATSSAAAAALSGCPESPWLPTGVSPLTACLWLVTSGAPHGVSHTFRVCTQSESVVRHDQPK